jgi:hypothetical protein
MATKNGINLDYDQARWSRLSISLRDQATRCRFSAAPDKKQLTVKQLLTDLNCNSNPKFMARPHQLLRVLIVENRSSDYALAKIKEAVLSMTG